MTAARSPSLHLGWLDGVRGLAAAYVVLHHAVLNIGADGTPDCLGTVLGDLFALGHVAVDVFIVLSGFCLLLPLARAERFGSVLVFQLRRTVRIVLPYYAAVALSLAAIALWIGHPSGTHWDVSLPVRAKDVVAHLLLVHQWGDTTSPTINHALWSVGVEYQIYFLFPLLFLALRRLGWRLATLMAVVGGYAVWAFTWHEGWPNPSPYGASFYYFGLFAMGAAAAQLGVAPDMAAPRRPLPRRVHLLLWSVTLAVAAALLGEGALHHVENKKQLVSLYAGSVTAALLWFHARHPWRRDVLALPALRWLGGIAFSLYLVHAPVLELVWRWAVRPLALPGQGEQMLLTGVLGLAASVAVAAVFHRLVERPCHQLSRAIGRRSASSAPWSPRIA